MNELIPTIQNRDIPEDWDYSESVKKERQIVWKWKNITIEMLHELWIAHELLDARGQNKGKEKVTNVTFSSYCDEISISRMTAYRWLCSYDPYLKISEEKEIPEHLETKYMCPRCSYEWD